MDTLVALCDILRCTPNDLIKLEVVNTQIRKTASSDAAGPSVTPRRTVVRRPGQT